MVDDNSIIDCVGQTIRKGDVIGIAYNNHITRAVVKRVTSNSVQYYGLYPNTDSLYQGYINSFKSQRLIKIDPTVLSEEYKECYDGIINHLKGI